jgi:hypothetical protein
MENIIIEALSEALNSQSVQQLFAELGSYQTIEHASDGSIIYQFLDKNVDVTFDENDILTKFDIRVGSAQLSPLEDIVKKYAHKKDILQQLGQPKITHSQDPKNDIVILGYDLNSYWMRFELNEDKTHKIVYLSTSSVGMNYKQPNRIMRTCKNSGKA